MLYDSYRFFFGSAVDELLRHDMEAREEVASDISKVLEHFCSTVQDFKQEDINFFGLASGLRRVMYPNVLRIMEKKFVFQFQDVVEHNALNFTNSMNILHFVNDVEESTCFNVFFDLLPFEVLSRTSAVKYLIFKLEGYPQSFH